MVVVEGNREELTEAITILNDSSNCIFVVGATEPTTVPNFGEYLKNETFELTNRLSEELEVYIEFIAQKLNIIDYSNLKIIYGRNRTFIFRKMIVHIAVFSTVG